MPNVDLDRPNMASSWRRKIAEKIAPAYVEIPAVAGVILGGSTARGHADRYSDIEIGVFWHAALADMDRERAAQKLRVDAVRHYPYEPAEEVWADDLIIGNSTNGESRSGVLVEVVHYTTDFVARTMKSVCEDFDTDLGKQNLISGIVDGIPLAGDAMLNDWKKVARNYPDELARAMVERYGVIDHFWRWQMLLDRGENLMLLYQMFSHVEQQVIAMLLALNHTYYFGLKWIDIVTDRLALAPQSFRKRLNEPFQLSPEAGAERLKRLVEDTFDLVEQEMPQVNVDRLRGYFRYRRPFLDEPPEGY